MFMTPLGLATDIATYTLANAQYDAGQTNNPDVLVSVDPQNISLNRETKLTWWPRSYGSVPRATKQVVGYFGIHLNEGQTMRWLVRLGWLLAISLWTCFFLAVSVTQCTPLVNCDPDVRALQHCQFISV